MTTVRALIFGSVRNLSVVFLLISQLFCDLHDLTIIVLSGVSILWTLFVYSTIRYFYSFWRILYPILVSEFQ